MQRLQQALYLMNIVSHRENAATDSASATCLTLNFEECPMIFFSNISS
jgi:hypothetical protein